MPKCQFNSSRGVCFVLLFPLLQDIASGWLWISPADVKLTVVQCVSLRSRAASGQCYKINVMKSDAIAVKPCIPALSLDNVVRCMC